MTTLTDRDRTALVVIDVQNGVVTGAHDRDGVVNRIADLVERARAAEVPVIWVQHQSDDLVPGSDAWKYVPELTRAEDEPLVEKRYPDSFEETTFEATLAELQVGSLLVTGAQSDACIRATLHGAVVRGYDAKLVGDAHTTEDLSAWGAPPPAQVVAHTNIYWADHSAPGREAGVVSADQVEF
jgi:nicotinamidase-related amidase